MDKVEARTSRVPSFQLPSGTSKRGVIVIDTDHCIAFTDENILELLGISSEHLVGRLADEAVGSVLKHCFDTSDRYEESWLQLMERPDLVLDEVLHVVGDSGRVLHRYSAPVFGENKDCVGRVEIYSDITKRKELESAVRHAYEELRATQDQLVQSEKLRAVGEIASGVAHDFNNTLGIILGNIQLLLRLASEEGTRTRLQSAERAALDAVDTVRRIQEFTKSQPAEQASVLDLSAIAAEVIEMMKPTWKDAIQSQGKRIDVGMDLGEYVLAPASAPEIREVLINIFFNAVQAMPDGGMIHVSTGRSRVSSWVRVADTGIGMSEDVRKRVFDPFFTTRGVAGTGLGMSVAYGIISRHKGNISVESVPGKGTVVTVFLPAADLDIAIEPLGEVLAPSSISPVKILVVDDEAMFAEVLVEMLSECGHSVCIASSGPEAVEQFRESPFDIVFTDLGMPEMSGWQVAKSIKEIEPLTPVVLLTGWGATLDETELELSDVDVVLSKPVKIEDLSAAIAGVLADRE